ncbi:MAG: hypothetical protein OMM_06434 [Candidatus Magnetoglobus multicellularis str. Araruama]|uniref:DUF5132 domain-containing protein n=1 Tax=Candidatus Magnetoglobus multicellularis str. Araruama TaxID=890399 RepID=A0A1V1PHV2_9BACT|nr:MAG: hypothetical protein OMM_06434 [Candidatus Magnetoglobus multicellularis str. Araruama]
MAFSDDLLKTGGSIIVGAAAIMLAPVVIPIVSSAARPIAKAAIKSSIIAFEKIKVVAADTRETIEDLAAEARQEIVQITTEARQELAESVA